MILNSQPTGDWSSEMWRFPTTFLDHKHTANMWWIDGGILDSKLRSLQAPSGFSVLVFESTVLGRGRPSSAGSSVSQHTPRGQLSVASHHSTHERPTDGEDASSAENPFKYKPRGGVSSPALSLVYFVLFSTTKGMASSMV